MMLALWLFEAQFLRIVSISFTALIANELLMVALEINMWHSYMVYSQVGTVLLYLVSMIVLKQEFGIKLFIFLIE